MASTSSPTTATAMMCSLAQDNSFGPYAGEQCRGGFDFTMLFEESIMITPLSILLILATPLRIYHLSRRKLKVRTGLLLYGKLAINPVYSGLLLVTLVLWCSNTAYKTDMTIASAALQFFAAVSLGFLSYFEHVRTVRPALIPSSYLLLNIALSMVRIRTLWLLNDKPAIAGFSSAAFAAAIGLLVLESIEKKRLLLNTEIKYPPEATSGILSRSTFAWLNGLMMMGYRKIVRVSDLYDIDRQLGSDKLQQSLFRHWKNSAKSSKYSLLWVLMKTIRRPLLEGVFPRLCVIGLTFSQPFMINRAIELSASPINSKTTNEGKGIIGAYALVYIGMAILGGQYSHKTNRATVMMRGSLVAAIYRKALDLPITAADPNAAITLMSTDVERIAGGVGQIHETWANLVEVALAIWLLERQLGVACIVPVVLAVASVIATGQVAGLVAKNQLAWLTALQTRIAVTAGILGGMKSIKLAGLTNRTFSTIHSLRVTELEASKKLRRVMIWVILLTFSNPIFTPILSFLVYALIAQSKNDKTLLAAKAFTSLALFTLLTTPLNAILTSLPNITAAISCVTRIQEHLLLPSREDNRIGPSGSTSAEVISDPGSPQLQKPTRNSSGSSIPRGSEKGVSYLSKDVFVVDNGMLGWTSGTELLKDVNIRVQRGNFAMVVGPTGSGKSTLIKGFLGELPFGRWPLRTTTKHIAFCDQTPWLPNRTVRDIIQGSSDYDPRWYRSVVQACALDEDFRQWDKGDQSLVGSKGLTMSGGQKQRIALARAVYSRMDIVILDDVLTGLDSDTENLVFHRLFGARGLFKKHGKTVILVSSTGIRIPYADQVIALDSDGEISEQGTFESLRTNGGYVNSLGLSDPNWDFDEDDDDLDEFEMEYFSRPGSISGEKETKATKEGKDTKSKKTEDEDMTAAEEASRSTGDITVYKEYFTSVGALLTLVFSALICCFIFGNTFPDIWINWWTAANLRNPNGELGKYLGVYAALGIIAVGTLTSACAIVFLIIIPKSGLHFHSSLLNTVKWAPLSFFWKTDTGVTLNRFSQDLANIDMELPMAALLTIVALLNCIAQLVLIAVAVHYVAISFPFYLALFYFLQKFYLHTSRQMRFMELESKSSVYTQFLESLGGVTTIRAFGWEERAESENCGFLDTTNKPYYLLFCIQRWLNFTIDMLIATMAIILITIAIFLRGKISPGYMGIALVNIMSLNASMKLLVNSWTSLETSIGSVSRVRHFMSHTKSEDQPWQTRDPPSDWPLSGGVSIKNIAASYKEGEPVLKDISIEVAPGQKVGICGRNGSGKSTLILCFLRMLNLDSGSIVIDGIDINEVPAETVRERVVAVAQDAYTFSGSVRLNADPTDTLPDSEIIAALTKVQLWESVKSKGGLDEKIDDLALSQGQKQLFCFARAMLRKSKILVLDEAMSSVDLETDNFIEKLIQDEFAYHTIISISHKLDSIMDYDKVIVLDKGTVLETGIPRDLIARKSAFRKLYDAAKGTPAGINGLAHTKPVPKIAIPEEDEDGDVTPTGLGPRLSTFTDDGYGPRTDDGNETDDDRNPRDSQDVQWITIS